MQIFFIYRLRQLDLEFMRRLHRKVNIVPVIAKADTLTASEVKRLKERIMADIEENQIQIYQFPDCDSDEDEEFKEQDRELKASVPFAVIGSNVLLEINGKQVRGRQYPWGIVEGMRLSFSFSLFNPSVYLLYDFNKCFS